MPSAASSSSTRSRVSDKRSSSTKRGESRPNGQRRSRIASKKSGELFARLNANSFVTLVLQAAQVALEEQLVLRAIEDARADGEAVSIDTTEITEDPVERALLRNGISTTDRSTLQSVIVGVGESDFTSEAKRTEARNVLGMPKPVDTNRPYLLLDVRDEDAFKKCRIITAFNYPSSMLARMFNYETRELVAFKNTPGKLIIFYDDLERDSPRVASTLYERGYDNIYVLTGGLKALYRSYPQALITGDLPVQVLRSSPETTRKHTSRPTASSSLMARSSSSPSIPKLSAAAGGVGGSGKSRRDSKSGATSTAHHKWNAFDENGRLKETLDDEELRLLRDKLEHNLLPRMKKNNLGKATLASKAQTTNRGESVSNSAKPPPRAAAANGSKPWY